MRQLLCVAAGLLQVHDGVRSQSPTNPTAEFTMVGTVLGQDGEPVRAAEVWVTAVDAPDIVVRRTRTDGEGMFLLGRLAHTKAIVHAKGEGMTPAAVDYSKLDHGTVLTAECRLWDARTLRGRVVDEQGNAIAGASLVAHKDGNHLAMVPIEGTTDQQGNFELTGVAIGDCVLRATAPGFVCNSHWFRDWIDERADLQLRRGDGVQLELSVEGMAADAMASTRVHLQAVADGSCRMPRAIEWQRLDALGKCTAKGLPETEWIVSMHHPDYRFASAIRVPRCAAPDPLRFLARPIEPTSVSGRVLQHGQPAVRQTIQLHRGFGLTNQPLQTVTDAQGRFEFGRQLSDEGPFLLELADPGLAFEQSDSSERYGRFDKGFLGLHAGRAPEPDLQLTAVRAISVRGRVHDATGRAVPFAMIDVQTPAGSLAGRRATREPRFAWLPVCRTVSGPDGTYVLGGLQPDPRKVRLRAAASGAIGATEPFAFDEVDGTINIRTELPGRIEGLLLDEFGDAHFGVEVLLQGEQITRVLTDYRGKFVFVGLAPGTYRVTVQLAGATMRASGPVEIKASELVRVDLL